MVDPTRVISARPRRVAWLFIANGPQAGKDFRVDRDTILGRSPMQCDVILSDEMVSDKHARIKREGEAFVIYDLASTNGTFVNARQVQKQVLHDEDEIRAGSTRLVFKATSRCSAS